MRERGSKDMVFVLQQFIGPNFLKDENQENEVFDLKNLFEHEPDHTMLVLLDHQLSRCKNPRNESNEIFCFKMNNGWNASSINENEATDILQPFNLTQGSKKVMIKDMFSFLSLKEVVQEKFKTSESQKLLKVSELYQKFPTLKLDWIKMMSAQLLNASQLNNDDITLIKNPELLQQLLVLTASLNRR